MWKSNRTLSIWFPTTGAVRKRCILAYLEANGIEHRLTLKMLKIYMLFAIC